MASKPPDMEMELEAMEGETGQGILMDIYEPGVPSVVEDHVEDHVENHVLNHVQDASEDDRLDRGSREALSLGDPGEPEPPDQMLGLLPRFSRPARSLSLWESCSAYRGPIAGILLAILALLVSFLSMYWSHTSVQQNKEILARVPTETTARKISLCLKTLALAHKKLDLAKKANAEKDETIRSREEFIKEMSRVTCPDVASISSPAVHCNFSNCKDQRVDGMGTVFSLDITKTRWFPSECLEGYAVIDISCFSKQGQSVALEEREHPDCSGKKQFKCWSVGMRPDYYGHDFFRDVYVVYKTCQILAINGKPVLSRT